MIDLTVKEQHLHEMIHNLLAFRDALRDRRTPLKKIKEQQVEAWKINFLSEGARYGPWAPQAASTVAARGPSKILFRTGLIFGNVVAQSRRGEVTKTSLLWEFENEPPAYPAFHHRGGYIANPRLGSYARVPSRIIWAVNEDDAKRAESIIDAWVDDIIHRYFS